MQEHRLPPLEWRKEPGLLLTSKTQRTACLALYKGICFDCKKISEKWHAEHDVALHAIPPFIGFPAALKYWRIDNLRLRCLPCHAIKSKSEAKVRAKIKRLQRKANGLEDKWRNKVAQKVNKFKPSIKNLDGRAIRIKKFVPRKPRNI